MNVLFNACSNNSQKEFADKKGDLAYMKDYQRDPCIMLLGEALARKQHRIVTYTGLSFTRWGYGKGHVCHLSRISYHKNRKKGKQKLDVRAKLGETARF